MKRKLFISLALVLISVFLFSSCREASKVSYNLSKEADQFNVVRRLTVLNCRTDKALFQITGTFSIDVDSDGDLNIICELEDRTYTKHFVHLNEWTTYTVEDLTGTAVSKYYYEINFLPEYLPGVKITSSY